MTIPDEVVIAVPTGVAVAAIGILSWWLKKKYGNGNGNGKGKGDN